MEVERYSFGRIRIGGREYTSDIIVGMGYLKDNWWRKDGHRIQIDDIADILRLKPEIVIFGIGANGVVKVDEEVLKKLKNEGMEIVVRKTNDAVRIYNEMLKKGKKVVLAAHLTC